MPKSEIQPTDQDLYNLGNALAQQGNMNEALSAYQRSLERNPSHWLAQNNAGNALMELQRFAEAADAFRRTIHLNPGYAEAHNNLGNALAQLNRRDEAIQSFQNALRCRPDYAAAFYNLGNVFREAKWLDQAIAAYREAIRLEPRFWLAHNNLANALKQQGQLHLAHAAYRNALALQPNAPESRYNLANVLKELGQLDQAIAAYRLAIRLRPTYTDAYINLGNALQDARQLDEAIDAYRHVTQMIPARADAFGNLGNAYKAKGEFELAINCYHKALAIEPMDAKVYGHLGNVLKDQARITEALAAYRQALRIQPDHVETFSNLVFGLHYDPHTDPGTIAAEHRAWGRQFASPAPSAQHPHTNDRSRDKRLRIGYVSPDFRDHAVARFLSPLLANHDKSVVEVFAYAQQLHSDETTQEMRKHIDIWRPTIGVSDGQLAEQIRIDQIDILVDLAGHTAGNRLLTFALAPAPVQVTWLGYPDSTGLTTMDYRLTDALADPPGMTERYHSEHLVRLPHGAWCFAADAQMPPVALLPAFTRRTVTFGSFNQWGKINDDVLRLWARILQAVPQSTLLLKGIALGGREIREHVIRLFDQNHVNAERLQLHGSTPTRAQHLALYNEMDIALDPFPYNGTTTTCEALWMGLPVITLAGNAHVSRVGISLLNRIGLSELVAHTPDAYVEIARSLAGDLPRLAQLRSGMRERMQNSPLMDGKGFARDVEAAYRDMWTSKGQK